MKGNRTYFILILLIFVSLFSKILFWEFVQDDAFITLRYSKNLIDGNGFVYNVGERVFGITTFLWALILSGVYYVGLDPMLFSKLLGVLFSVAIIPLVYLLTMKLFKNGKAAIIASLFIAIDPYFSKWSVSGMETLFFSFLLILSIYFYLSKKRILSSFFCGIATLTRPEGVFLFISIFFIDFIKVKNGQKLTFFIRNVVCARSKEKSLKFFKLLFPFSLIILSYFLWLFFYYGNPLPTTFGAKSFSVRFYELHSDVIFTTLKFIGRYFLIFPFFIYSAYFYFRHIKKTNINRYPLIIAIIINFLFHLYVGVLEERYIIPFNVFAFIYASTVIVGIRKRVLLPYLTIVIISLLLLNIPAYIGIKEYVNSLNGYVLSAEWLLDNTDKNTIIATPSIGALGYFSQRKIVDIDGLVTPEIMDYLKNDNVCQLFLSKNVSYVFIHKDAHSYNVILSESCFKEEYQYFSTFGKINMFNRVKLD